MDLFEKIKAEREEFKLSVLDAYGICDPQIIELSNQALGWFRPSKAILCCEISKTVDTRKGLKRVTELFFIVDCVSGSMYLSLAWNLFSDVYTWKELTMEEFVYLQWEAWQEGRLEFYGVDPFDSFLEYLADFPVVVELEAE